MRLVLQRVSYASVTIDKKEKRSIGKGLVALVGIGVDDTDDDVRLMCRKCAELRVFSDEEGRLNLSAAQQGLDILAVSNFTLYADCRKGRRPGFSAAARPPESIRLYNLFVKSLAEYPFGKIETGEFGADMQLEILNDGPITLILDTDEWKK